MRSIGVMPRLAANLAARARLIALPLLALLASANTASAPLRYTLDARASEVAARVPFFGLASKTARFPRMEGTVSITPGAPERAMIDVTFDATALEAPDPVTLARLRGEKFFWVEKYPEVRFVGRALKLATPTRGTVSGELTARGITRAQVLDVTFEDDPVASPGKAIRFTGTTTIDRRAYGMKAYPLIVGSKVDITLKARMVPR